MSEALAAVDRPRPRTRHWISAACGLVAIAILALSWLLAVSYTHLDVYKRQGRHRVAP